MVRDAEAHASEDARRKEEVETRNVADSTIYAAEKFLSDNGANIPEAQKTAVQSQIERVKSAMQGGDAASMKDAAAQLQNALQQAGAAMYQQAGPAAAGDGPTGGAAGGSTRTDEDVIEGEFS
jgi:molecular chaperone DnaK